MKAQPTLLCIPDISGFTEFMGEADFELSSKVIPSLLNNIVYSNEIGLKISEIEGDAVLFYRQGTLPSFRALVDQCRYFYTEFYKQLNELRTRYREMDSAALIPEVLGLKIVLHYGTNIAPVKVGARIKLLGEDLIVAHRLLKNTIAINEYILLSEALTQRYPRETLQGHWPWGELKQHREVYEHVGPIRYHYIGLKPLLG